MAFIDDAIQDAVSDVQHELLRALLERKLTEAGIPMPPETIDAYAKHLLSGDEDGFVWDGGDEDWESKLDLTDEDEAELDVAIDQILGKVALSLSAQVSTRLPELAYVRKIIGLQRIRLGRITVRYSSENQVCKFLHLFRLISPRIMMRFGDRRYARISCD